MEVVPIHDDVYGKVECNWYPGNGGVPNELCVAEESSSAMMVGVKEGYKISGAK